MLLSSETRAKQFVIWRDMLTMRYSPILVTSGLIYGKLWDLAIGPDGPEGVWYALLTPKDDMTDDPSLMVIPFEPFIGQSDIASQIRDGLRAGIAARFVLIEPADRPVIL